MIRDFLGHESYQMSHKIKKGHQSWHRVSQLSNNLRVTQIRFWPGDILKKYWVFEVGAKENRVGAKEQTH